MLIANARDTRLMTLYCQRAADRLRRPVQAAARHPRSYEAKDSSEFTLKLRAGHKWSDGQPFTTEDFRFFWEDVANNKELSPRGPNVELLVDGKPPKVEIIDPLTIKLQLGQAQPLLHRKPGARRARCSCSGRRTTSRSSTASTRRNEEIAKAAKGGQAPAGCRSIAAST